jgi:hypothetical protein
MRYLAVSRFRHLTIVRTATPIFVIAVLPVVAAAIAVSIPEPKFRDVADYWLLFNASAAVKAWFFHALFLSVAGLMSGKVKTSHDFVATHGIPDLMDTAPIGEGARFWGEALGTLETMAVIHLCCLPLLVAVAALSPLPTVLFVWMEAATMALLVLASTGAAWQRRAPRRKYSATRGPRNAAVLAILFLLALLLTTRPRAFRDSTAEFLLFNRPSMRGWSEVMATVENPILLVTLLSMLYAGTITYYYVSSTRKRTWEN